MYIKKIFYFYSPGRWTNFLSPWGSEPQHWYPWPHSGPRSPARGTPRGSHVRPPVVWSWRQGRVGHITQRRRVHFWPGNTHFVIHLFMTVSLGSRSPRNNFAAGKCFTYVTKTIANSTTYSRKPGDYNGTIIFEFAIMKNSSPLNLKFTFFATVEPKMTILFSATLTMCSAELQLTQ